LAAVLAFVLLRGGLVGHDAPDFTLRGAYGGSIDKRSFRGKPILLMFWTTSCPVCRHEMPIVDRIAIDFRREGVEVIAVNIGDTNGARDVLREFRMTNMIDESGAAARSFKVSGMPKFVLIDSSGKVKREASGFQPEGALRGWLQGVMRR
jgi:thiol-disulfide isomerase/thioredoxin